MTLRTLGIGWMVAGLLALPGTLAAQTTIGAGAGVTFSNLTGEDVDDESVDASTGFYVGGSLGIPLGGILGLSTGAYYVQKGAQEADDGDGSLDLAYLEIPALLQVQVTAPDRPVGISLFLGPAFAFNLSCDSSDDGTTADCGDDVASLDFGALFGAGAAFAAGESATVTVNAGLDLGLTNIEVFGEDEDVKNQAYFLGFGLIWPLGG